MTKTGKKPADVFLLSLELWAATVLFAATATLTWFALFRRPAVPPAIAVGAELPPLPLPSGVDENFMSQVERCFLPVAAAKGFELRITSAYRTKEEQDEVFRQGRWENGHIVTEVPGGWSLHNFGLAVDVVDRRRGYNIDWDRLGGIAEYCGLEQNDEGDQAHFTHRAGLTIPELTIGHRPPPLALPCDRLGARASLEEPLTKRDLEECGIAEL